MSLNLQKLIRASENYVLRRGINFLIYKFEIKSELETNSENNPLSLILSIPPLSPNRANLCQRKKNCHGLF